MANDDLNPPSETPAETPATPPASATEVPTAPATPAAPPPFDMAAALQSIATTNPGLNIAQATAVASVMQTMPGLSPVEATALAKIRNPAVFPAAPTPNRNLPAPTPAPAAAPAIPPATPTDPAAIAAGRKVAIETKVLQSDSMQAGPESRAELAEWLALRPPVSKTHLI